MVFDQETGCSCDEQRKKAPSEMGKTGPGLKKKEEGESVVHLSLWPGANAVGNPDAGAITWRMAMTTPMMVVAPDA